MSAEGDALDKIISENKTLKDLFRFFKKGNCSSNLKADMA